MRIAPCIVASALLVSLDASAQTLKPNCESSCTVVITMSAGCGSGIKVAPDPIVVPPGATPTITWEIKADAWAFDDNGIFIHQATSESFEKGPGGGKTFKFKNFNNKNKPRAYKYDINLKGPDGKCKLDPTVVNQ